VAAARIRHRLAAGGDASDATPAIAAALASAADPWPEAAGVDTTGDDRRTLRDALAIVRNCGIGLPA
jgi:predicted kinase